ncbi:hypothetical protein [Endozoicomonas elysicola]|uniref:Thymidylate kinase-like domain-containing protein n=1 Tax=Endozoicomonas elysicola TaxID=305900 RepID=A0A081K9D0_9GAMM|nr:hypothetical protein [Endozoicomonas elysicola]KEI70756.1 hypothetical protein GV64_08375 [Endozoicomonas elysicola]
MYKEVFSFFEENNIEYAVLNGYEELENIYDTAKDVDILIERVSFGNLRNIIHDMCKENNFSIVQILHHDVWAMDVFLYSHSQNQMLHLDFYAEVSSNGKYIYSTSELLKNTKNYRGFKILSPAHELITYFDKCIRKNNFSKEVLEKFGSLLFENSKASAELQRIFGEDASLLESIFANKDTDLLVDNIDVLKDKINQRKITARFYLLGEIKRIISRILKPTGITIAFYGCDGVGKSTVIEKIIRSQMPFRQTQYFHFKPLHARNTTEGNSSTPHLMGKYSYTKSVVKLFYFVLQYNLGWLKNISPLRVKSYMIIFDRYYFDIFVDQIRYRYGASDILLRLAGWLIPKPNISFVLVAPPEVIYARKQEVELANLSTQVYGYKKLAKNNDYYLVEANSSLDKVVKTVRTHILDQMKERHLN